MEFVLIRHTRCEIERGVCYGQLDVQLAVTHPNDIEVTLARSPQVDAVFSSPARRCLGLAQRLMQRDRCELIVLDELQELHFGEWEGRHWDVIAREQSDPWAADPWTRAPPGGETEHDLFVRVERALQRIRSCGHRRAAIVAHAGPLRLAACLLTGRPLEARWKWMIEQGEVIVLDTAAQPLLDGAARS